MFRRSVISFCGTYPSSLNPYDVLGISRDASFDEVRFRFYKLTQQYHPDTPTGDPVKFREINAAYRLLRSNYRSGVGGANARKGDPNVTGGAFWSEQNKKVREQMDRRRQQERREAENRARRNTKKTSLIGELLTLFTGYEIALSIGSVIVVLIYSVERYRTVQRMSREKALHLKNMDEGLPPPMPMEADPVWQEKYQEAPAADELHVDALRIKEESYYRRATQRRFEDFREFMFVFDPDAIASRKVSTQRFSHQYLEEQAIAKRCPILKEVNSDLPRHGYEHLAKELEKEIEATPWVYTDAAYAGGLVAKGLNSIAANSPKTTKWTFIEYQHVDSSGSTAAANQKKGKRKEDKEGPMCLAAIRNLRFQQTGMCQRVVVTGREELQPSLAAARQAALDSGKLKRNSLVRGGAIPVKDLSVKLENMQL